MFRIQQKIARILFIFGIFATVINLIIRLFFRGMSLLETLSQANIYTSIIYTLVIFLTGKINHKSVRILHVLILVVISATAIMDEYDSFYGLGFMILALMLSYRYGFLDKGLRWKASISILMLFGIIEFSTYRNNPEEIAVAVDAFVFLILFIAFIYVIFKEEIDRLSSTNIHLETNLSELKKQRRFLEQELDEKNLEIECYIEKKRIPVLEEEDRRRHFKEEYRLTNREMMTLMLAYDSGESNQYIAEKLGIKASTVKQHLNRAFGKIDARNKSDMHAMIRDYVPDSQTATNPSQT